MSYFNIPGWIGDADEEVYDLFVRDARDGETIVEVGVGFGRSLAYLGERVIASKKRIKIVGVDPWNEAPAPGRAFHASFAAFKASMRHAPEVLRMVRLIRKPSLEAARAFAPGAIGFCFLDASNAYEGARADIAAWAPLVTRRGGVLAGRGYDESTRPGVVRAVREAFGASGYKVKKTCWWRRNP